MNYYISDTHFGSKNRKRGQDEIIRKNWNNVVHKNDHVYIVGDIMDTITTSEEYKYIYDFISSLKGHKHLIIGNHDYLKSISLLKLFDEVCNYKELTDNFNGRAIKLVLSHYPIMSWNEAFRPTSKKRILLYGHTHENFDDVIFQKSLSEMRKYLKINKPNSGLPYAYNLGCKCPDINLCPRTIDEILHIKKEKTEVIYKNTVV